MGAVREALIARFGSGELEADPAQLQAAGRLDALAGALGSQARPRAAGAFFKRFRGHRQGEVDLPRGLYVHGPVGSGKSMLMDLFFDAAPVERKRRVHFHAFMLEVHERLHRLRQTSREKEPLRWLAGALAAEARLLCFDEFVVYNIADAMILGRLFEALFGHGVVVVATSNFPPERLYEGGLNRDRFMPFIELLKDRVEVIELAGGSDYRRGRLTGIQVYHHPLDDAARAALDAAFGALGDGAPAPAEVRVGARVLEVPAAAGGVARFGFEDLCARALGAADYLALTERYHTIILDRVPVLMPDRRNEARRFITLVDALYETRVKLIMSAAAAPDELHPAGEGAFEFQRTASRLMEMQSQSYLESAKQPLKPGTTLDFALTTDLL